MQDEATQHRLATATATLLSKLDEETSSVGTTSIEVLLAFCAPPGADAAADAAPDTAPVFHSPYSWIASAWAGGLARPRESDIRRVLLHDAGDARSTPFEQWVLRISVVYDTASPPDLESLARTCAC